jgi:chromosome segregation ATPase
MPSKSRPPSKRRLLSSRSPIATEISVVPRPRSPKIRRTTEPKVGGEGTGVLLEEMRANFKAVIEMVGDCATKREVDEFRRDLSARTDLLTDALRVTRDEVKLNTTRLDGIDARLEGVDTRLQGVDTRLEGVDTRLQGVDTRLQGVDTRLEGVDTRLQGVDTRLEGIQTRLEGVQQELQGVRRDVARQAERAELLALEQRMTAVERHLGL